MRHPRAGHLANVATVLLGAALTTCGGHTVTQPGDASANGTSAFDVSGHTPASGASSVDLVTTISVDFTQPVDPATVTVATFTLTPSSTGKRVVSGSQVTFRPDSLKYDTKYTVRLTTGIQATDHAPLDSAVSWSFTTRKPPPPAFQTPLETGKQWRYTVADTDIVSAVETGTDRTIFLGERFVRVAGQVLLGGKAAAKVVFYDFNSTPSSASPAIAWRTEYLSRDAGGLWRWTGSGWTRMLAFDGSAVADGTFFMIGSPSEGSDLTISTASVTVPAGAYQTLRAVHESSEHGQYATEQWDVSEREDWADGVGLVEARWVNSFDNKDPMAADYSQFGHIALTNVDVGPFPDFVDEAEPNDSATQAQMLQLPRAIATGTVYIGDPGALFTGSVTNCPTPCVHPDENGVPRLEDWYAFDVTATRQIQIDLVYQGHDSQSNTTNDLDLYAFRTDKVGNLVYETASLQPEGKAESLTGTVDPGRYYLAVQAWRSRGAPVPYLLSVR